MTPIENLKSFPPYDEEKYKEMILDAAETVLGYLLLIDVFTAVPRKEENGMNN